MDGEERVDLRAFRKEYRKNDTGRVTLDFTRRMSAQFVVPALAKIATHQQIRFRPKAGLQTFVAKIRILVGPEFCDCRAKRGAVQLSNRTLTA